jgi:site-specific DNA-methyltransferase (adenine-specific)
MKKVSIGLLRPNSITSVIYGDRTNDENFLTLKKSIELEGILEPLIITNDFFIISGMRRYCALLELGIEEVPVVVSSTKEEEVDQFMVINHQQQRLKSAVQVLREIEIIKNKYGLKQGRKSTNPEVIQGKKEKERLFKIHSSSTIERLQEAKKNLSVIHNGDEKKVWEELFKMDSQGKSAHGILKLTKGRKKKEVNERTVKGGILPVTNTEKYELFNMDCRSMRPIPNESIDCVFTSPPYYIVRDYHTGDKQIGREKSIEEFLNNLMQVFKEVKRVLKDTGNVFVNLGDTHVNGVLLNIPGLFKKAMIEEGFLYISEIIWVKKNPIFTSGNRAMPTYEYIFHFAKTPNYKFYRQWITDAEFGGQVTVGDNKKSRQLRDFLDYRNCIANTSVVNNQYLVQLFKENGYELNHNATYPFEVPCIGILSTTQEGDSVLDPFNGIGSTGIGAVFHNRKYYGFDNNPYYLEMSKIRLNNFIKELELGNVVSPYLKPDQEYELAA